MLVLDSLFNSYRKRLFWLFTAMIVYEIYSVSHNFIVGSYLSDIESLSDLLALTEYEATYQTFLGNFAVDVLDGLPVFQTFIRYFGMERFLLLGLWIAVLFSNLPQMYKFVKPLSIAGALLKAAEYGAVFYLAMRAMNASTSLEAVKRMSTAGDVLCYISVFQILSSLLILFILVTRILNAK